MWMIRRIGFVAIAISLIPVALVALAGSAQHVLDCNVLATPCKALGTDITPLIVTLYSFSLVGLLYAMPALATVFAWFLIEIIYFVRTRWFP